MLATVEISAIKVTDMNDTLLGDREAFQERKGAVPCYGDARGTEKTIRPIYPFLSEFLTCCTFDD